MAVFSRSQPKSILPNVYWSSQLAGYPITAIVETDSILLIPTKSNKGDSSNLYALDQRTGSTIWKKQFPFLQVTGILVASTNHEVENIKGIIFVSTLSTNLLQEHARLYALDMYGNQIWGWAHDKTNQLSAPAKSTVTESIYITVDRENLIELNWRTGQPMQKIPLPTTASINAPAVTRDIIYVPCRGPHLLAFEKDGRLKWQYNHPQKDVWLNHTPLHQDGHLYTIASDNTLLAINSNTGTLSWKQNLPTQKQSGSPIEMAKGRLFIGGSNGIYAFSISGNGPEWHFPTNRPITAASVFLDGILYSVGRDHTVYALEAKSGKQLWQFNENITRRIELPPHVSKVAETHHITFAARNGYITQLAWPFSGQKDEIVGSTVTDPLLIAAKECRMSGELEKAAALYEAAEVWQKAATLWQILDQPKKRVDALYEHACQLSNRAANQIEKAEAWHQTSIAYAEIGLHELATMCARKAAKYRQQPIVVLDIQHDRLIRGEWGKITFFIENEGFGPAHNLIVRAKSTRFEFENGVSNTERLVTLPTQEKRKQFLNVKPLEIGVSVPLEISLEYDIGTKEPYHQQKYYHIRVKDSPGSQNSEKTTHFITTQVPLEDGCINLVYAQFRKNLQDHFSISELRTLCFDLKIDHENFEPLKEGFVRGLIEFTERHGRLLELHEYCQKIRPHVEW